VGRAARDIMRLLILGASGGCGRWATRLAHAAGHDVTALVRRDTAFDPPAGVAVRRGNVLSDADLSQAVAGQDAVISCLGAQRVNARNPWSPLRPPLDIARDSAGRLVQAMTVAGVGRLAAISAAGVGDSLPSTNALMRWLLRSSTVGEMYADLEAMERSTGRARSTGRRCGRSRSSTPGRRRRGPGSCRVFAWCRRSAGRMSRRGCCGWRRIRGRSSIAPR
jgi:hypothetical protein